MTNTSSMLHPSAEIRERLSKVPEVTLFFWIIKVLCTTVGETFADFINGKLGDNLNTTTIVMGSHLAVALVVQFRVPEYIPAVYWVAVVLISVVGTLITDNLVDNFGVRLQTTTIFFSLALIITFAVWYFYEKTLSIHTVFTTRREMFYWLAVMFTFALGTAAGDLVAESLNVGYLITGFIFAGVIAAVALAYFVFHIDAILAFWLAYILTRPLGASFGDLLSQPREYGGMGFGTIITSLLFLGTIAAIVIYMTLTHEGEERAVGAA